jgi:hypothetical protein
MGKQIFVTNKNDFVHTDAYDGEEYVFPPGERVLIPVEAATHMLGFGLEDQSDALVRLGWATVYNPDAKTFIENPDGVKRLARFVFDEAVMVSKSSLGPKNDVSSPVNHPRHV